MDQLGLEPRTSRLWVCCSNQLSYKSSLFRMENKFSGAKILCFGEICKLFSEKSLYTWSDVRSDVRFPASCISIYSTEGVGVSPVLLNCPAAERLGDTPCQAICAGGTPTPPAACPTVFYLRKPNWIQKSKCQNFNGFSDTLIFRCVQKQTVLIRFPC